MSDPGKAVFLSYASQDAEAARRICEALRQAGVEVWFDQSELRGGDAWDQSIRRQIKDCALFIPIISANTQARHEGYFRLEWRLADQRTHLMGKSKAFIVPVCIDDTRDADADVPDSFLAVQWTLLRRAYGGQARPGSTDSAGQGLDGASVAAFASRVRTLLDHAPAGSLVAPSATRTPAAAIRPPRRFRAWRARWVAAAFALGAIGFAAWRVFESESGLNSAAGTPAGTLIARAWEQLNDPALARSQLEVADELCRRATTLDPDDADAWAAWSQVDTWYVYHQFDDTPARREQARAKAARALQTAPKAFEPRLAEAVYFVRAADRVPPERATQVEKSLRSLLTERGEEPRVLFALATLLRHEGRYDEAAAVFHQLGRNAAFAATALNELAWMYCLAEPTQLAEATDDCERSIALRPFWANLALKAMLATIWLGDLDAAKVALDRVPVAQLADGFVPVIAFQVQWNRREPSGMLRALATHPGEWMNSNYFLGPLSYLYGIAHDMAGDHDAAVTQWRAALKQIDDHLVAQPDVSALHRVKADTLVRLGEKERARKEYELARQFATNPRMRAVTDYDRAVLFDDADAAFAQLERGVASGSRACTAAALRLLPDLDRLRGDPRFAALLNRAEADPRLSPTAKPAHVVTTEATAPEKSVAVLAFRQLSADPENEYLCEAISDELCNALGRMRGLKVAASASAFSFKGRQLPPAEMAAQLGVTYLVDGTVQKIGDRVRVRAQLINAADGFTVWSSDTLEHEAKDMFAVEDAVVGAIAKSLQLQLGTSVAPRAVNPEAYRLYYEGRRAWSLRASRGQTQRALDYFQKAIDLDPTLGRAYAGLAEASLDRSVEDAVDHSVSSSLYFGGAGMFGVRHSEVMKQALALAAKAIQLEPDSAEAHTARARVLWFGWRLAEAQTEARRALELNPSFADAHLVLARLLEAAGRLDEALAEARSAIELDPLTSRNFDNAALLLIDAGRYSEALAQVDHALALQPDSVQALAFKSVALSALGRHEEAVALTRRPIIAGSAFAVLVLLDAGLKSEAEKEARSLHGSAQASATALVALDRTDDAFKLLQPDNASVLGSNWLFYRPELDPIRRDPRFVRYLEKLGLTEANARAQAWRAAHPPEKLAAGQ